MKDSKIYSERIDKKLEDKQPFSAFNRDISHATAITRAAFRHASSKVRLLSHQLDSALYNTSLLDGEVANFLKKGGALHILVETDIPSKHPIWSFMEKNDYGSKVKIKKVPRQLMAVYGFNYLVVDSFGFRFEEDRGKCVAVASFHEDRSKAIISNLTKIFDALEERSSEIEHEARS